MKIRFALLLIILLITAFSVAETIQVPGDFTTIQAAIDASSDGDVIIIEPGIYEENIKINGRMITIRSTDPDDPTVVENTVIDGKRESSVITFSGNETKDTVLEGLTITNGYNDKGGGIDGANTQAILRKCIIKNNKSSKTGGGIHNFGGLIEKCIIRDNQCVNDNDYAYATGGGISFSKATIRNCIIYNNKAIASGSMIYFYMPGAGYICDPGTGSAYSSGGGLTQCSGTIENCIIYSNYCHASVSNCGTGDPGPSASGSSGISSHDGIIKNCIIVENTISTGSPTEYCLINRIPFFVNPRDGDFHLLPDSPCIDAGVSCDDVMDDFDCNSRPVISVTWEKRGDGSHWDIGPYEYTEEILPSDRQALIAHLLSHKTETSDKNGDGLIDIADLIFMIQSK
jgi:hypothetical protein